MKPSIPKGTRDFSANQVIKRNHILNTIKGVFKNFGFQPIETPSFENLTTLTGKYGEEGDRLIFKILNSGDFLNKADNQYLIEKNSRKLIPQISQKALRYDLTVPFARYVVQHQNEIDFPFKRYQIQPVWRADRPQRGRFREFYQCDADVVGSKSLWQEVEFVQMYDAVFSQLNLKETIIKINNRKILAAIAQMIGAQEKLIDFTIALDKLDKIGKDGVIKELISRGISQKAVENLSPLFGLSGTNAEKLTTLRKILKNSEQAEKGISEIEFIIDAIEELKLETAILQIDVTLARGLDYYTGAIFEVQPPKGVKMGSIGGGGRYDDLTGAFGLKDVSGVGISFGLDRIYLTMEQMDLFKSVELPAPEVLFVNFGQDEALNCMKVIKILRKNNIKSELYPDEINIKKQLNYANKRKIPFVVLAGLSEVEDGKLSLKNMKTGTQEILSLDRLIAQLK